MAQAGRFPQLDGLRGVAAVVVVLAHVLAVVQGAEVPNGHDLDFWTGNAAVMVFFVLSGFVLCRPFVGGRKFEARQYYPARLARLYLPVWAVLVIAAGLHLAAWDTTADGFWMTAHTVPISLNGVYRGATLFQAPDASLNWALWSLQWEICFSLLLPVYVVIARALVKAPWVGVVVALALIGAHLSSFTNYLPVFALGAMLASGEARLLASAERRPKEVVAVCVAVAAFGLTAGAWAPNPSDRLGGVAPALVALGACAAVAAALLSISWTRFLTLPPTRWLGSRSFSLYLIHEPLIVTLAFIGGADWWAPLYAVAAVGIALAAAEVFYRGVERPSHLFARSLGRRGSARANPTAVPVGTSSD